MLKEPRPSVIFEDFGESALIVSLYFWINLSPNTNPLQIMSDLRFMIEKNLREAGIMLAVPRRDIQFDSTPPIKVEFASADETPLRAGLQRVRPGSP